MKYLMKTWFLVLACVFIVSGCASTGSEKVTKNTPIQSLGAPDWVVKGSGAFGGEKGKVFYGIASASNIGNTALLRSTADNRARNEVAKVMQFYTASLAKDYAASTTAGADKAVSEEQHVEQAVKTVTAMTLSGVEIVDHWQNPETGEFFSLGRLDLTSFKDNIEKAKELDAKVKEYVKGNAERLHQQLEKETGAKN